MQKDAIVSAELKKKIIEFTKYFYCLPSSFSLVLPYAATPKTAPIAI